MKIAALALALIVAAPAASAAEADAIATVAAIEYRPAAGPQPPRRVGGSARGGPHLPSIAVLLPDHLALTSAAQPVLHWFLSQPTDARIEIVLADPRRAAPVFESAVSALRAGVQRFDLAAAGVSLEPDVEYEWSVAIVPDAAQRSRDVVAAGAIRRVVAAVAGAPAGSPLGRADALARAGLWIDAFAVLEAAGPDDVQVRAARAALLAAAGLNEAARFEARR